MLIGLLPGTPALGWASFKSAVNRPELVSAGRRGVLLSERQFSASATTRSYGLLT